MIVSPSPQLARIRTRFREEFAGEGSGGEPRLFFAPGRVNLVGAHLDYSGGDVLPMAVDRGVYAAVRAENDDRIRLVSLDQELEVDLPFTAVPERADADLGWTAYPIGVWQQFVARTGVRQGFTAVVGGDLPMASGLSSSAALEVAIAVALDALAETQLDHETLARLAHAAEREFVGVNCGIMDQFASALCRPGHALWLRCADQTYEHLPLSADACEVVVMDTRKPRQLADSMFNQRVDECAAAFAALSAAVGERACLAHFTPAELEAAVVEPRDVYLRARHVVTEMGRIARAVEALRRGDIAVVGAMLTESHRSTATDYAVSCDELDVVTAAACEVRGVYGARLTGAGFGGCAIALAEPGTADRLQAHVTEVFERRFGVTPAFDLLRPGLGAREIV